MIVIDGEGEFMRRNENSGLIGTLIIGVLILFILPVTGLRLLVNENSDDGDKVLGVILIIVGVIIWGIGLFS
ncbi:MAG: hypothetical protein ACLR9S_00150 [Lachnospiraceae bacterium]